MNGNASLWQPCNRTIPIRWSTVYLCRVTHSRAPLNNACICIVQIKDEKRPRSDTKSITVETDTRSLRAFVHIFH